MAIADYLKAIRRRWLLVVACVLLGGVIGYVLSPAAAPDKGPGHRATLTLIPALGGNPFEETAANRNLYLAAHLTSTPDVAALANQQLTVPLEIPEEGKTPSESVSASVDIDVASVAIIAQAPTEARAVELVNAYSEAVIGFMRDAASETYEAELATAQAQLDLVNDLVSDLQKQLDADPEDPVLTGRLDAELVRYGEAFAQVEALKADADSVEQLRVLGAPQVAELESSGISAPKNPRDRALLAAALGLLLGMVVAIVVDRYDTRLRERDDVEEAFGYPLLGEIPQLSRRARARRAVVAADRPMSVVAEAYRSLRSSLMLVAQSRGALRSASKSRRAARGIPRVVVVTGGKGGDGKSTTAVNLAAVIAELGRSVVVVDCDFRKPDVHRFLRPQPGIGLDELAAAHVNGNLDHLMRSTSVPGVSLVTSGHPVANPTDVLAVLPDVIAFAGEHADVVLIDTGPLLSTSDAVDVLQFADGVVVTCRVGRTTGEQASRTRRLLDRAEVSVLGLVLTGSGGHRDVMYGQPTRWQRFKNWLDALVRGTSVDAGRPPERVDSDDVTVQVGGHLSDEPAGDRDADDDAADPSDDTALAHRSGRFRSVAWADGDPRRPTSDSG